MTKLSTTKNKLPVSMEDISAAAARLRGIIKTTPLELSERLSKQYHCHVYLKREDLQAVRSYKIRGAYNFISSLGAKQKKQGVVCASAGNHAQGVAFACAREKTRGIIFMPRTTPKQKIQRVQHFGNGWVELKILGDTFDESSRFARELALRTDKVFVHPFDDALVIAGQGTVAAEILKQSNGLIDYIIAPVGGGGLISGMAVCAKAMSPHTKIIGVEPKGAACMLYSLKMGKACELKNIDKFVDGAAVKKPGELNFKITQKLGMQMLTAEENQVCFEMLKLYQQDGIIAEPAGALSVAALDEMKRQIKGKTVVCVISGGNNDISRYSEIMERALIYQGLKHYFLVEFAQRPGTLRRYLDEALGPGDDIVFFEYIKKNNRETGPAFIGIELNRKEDLKPLLMRMDKIGMTYQLIHADSPIYKLFF